MNIGEYISAALRYLGHLRARHWALLILVYSGRAMLPLLPAEVQASDVLAPVLSAMSFLVLLWMPYLFIRAMAGDAQPWRPNLGFVLFVLVAMLMSLLLALPATLAHVRFEAGVSPEEAQIWMLGAGVLGVLLTVRLLPLYAGTATRILSPVEPYWWTGMAGSAVPLAIVITGVFLIARALQVLIPPPGDMLTMGNILLSHAREITHAAAFLAKCALALAACHHCARLHETARAR